MDVTHTDANPATTPLQTDVTRRTAMRLGGAGLAALLLAAGSRAQDLRAQEASPAATPTGATGTTAQVMGVGQPTTAPGLELSLRRITIAPGGRIPAHSHPGALVIFVEAGSFGYTTLGGTVQLNRAAVGGTPAPAETVTMGSEVILNPGDWVFVENPQDDARNAGNDDVNLLIAGLLTAGEPFTTFMTGMEMGGTPAS